MAGLDDEGYVDFHVLNDNAENEPNRSNAVAGRRKLDGGLHSLGAGKAKGAAGNALPRVPAAAASGKDRAKPAALKPVKAPPRR